MYSFCHLSNHDIYCQCNANEFTCNNGLCIDLEQRCDNIFDCSDRSDELNCELLIIDEDYEKIFPPISRTGKTEVELSMKIKLFIKYMVTLFAVIH